MKQIITGGKLKGRSLEVKLTEILDDKSEREHPSIKCDQLVHPDLEIAFNKLKYHLAKLCEMPETESLHISDFNHEEHLVKFSVSSFSIGGTDDNEGVTISGSKELKSGKILNLNSPFHKFADDCDEYPHTEEIYSDIQNAIFEIEQYYVHGKYAPKTEPELPFLDENGNEMVVTISTDKPKRVRKKKEKEVTSEEVTDVDFEKE